MAKNTLINKPTLKKEKPNRISTWIAKVFDIEELVNGLPSVYLYYGIWLFLLIFIYIHFSLRYEGYIREVETLKGIIDEKRSEYISKKASFMKETKKSEILKKVAPYGLQENLVAPQKMEEED